MRDRESFEHRSMRLLRLSSTYGMYATTKGGYNMIDCEKCKYSYKNHCEKRTSRDRAPCHGCEMYDDDNSMCKCCVILADEYNCPYFVECEDAT